MKKKKNLKPFFIETSEEEMKRQTAIQTFLKLREKIRYEDWCICESVKISSYFTYLHYLEGEFDYPSEMEQFLPLKTLFNYSEDFADYVKTIKIIYVNSDYFENNYKIVNRIKLNKDFEVRLYRRKTEIELREEKLEWGN